MNKDEWGAAGVYDLIERGYFRFTVAVICIFF